MPVIAIPSDPDGRRPDCAVRAVEDAGGEVRILRPGAHPGDALAGAGGLLVADAAFASDGVGAGYAGILEAALAVDMPVLLTGRGMHLLNAVFGGMAAATVDGHCHADGGRHQIYLSPGSKVAAIIGGAGMYRVNSRHRSGLREVHRAHRLMSIAYQLDDGVIEGLESKEHGWVIGVQFLPELRDEVPAAFNNLFLGLVERAATFI